MDATTAYLWKGKRYPVDGELPAELTAVLKERGLIAAGGLTDLPGVGEEMAAALAEHGLDTVAAIAQADIEALTAVPGIGKATAKKLKAAASDAD